ncbi:MAG TPA: hypothetical protein VF601_21495 [Beijerinckiaceae bacterium]|jgi:hypothetical protein
MRQGDFRSAFAGETQGGLRPDGPIDLGAIGRTLGRALSDALAEPLPEEWRALLSRLDDRRSRDRSLGERRMAHGEAHG